MWNISISYHIACFRTVTYIIRDQRRHKLIDIPLSSINSATTMNCIAEFYYSAYYRLTLDHTRGVVILLSASAVMCVLYPTWPTLRQLHHQWTSLSRDEWNYPDPPLLQRRYFDFDCSLPPPKDNIWAMTIVWWIRRKIKIIRTVLGCTVCHNCAQRDRHTHEQFLHLTVNFNFCTFCIFFLTSIVCVC